MHWITGWVWVEVQGGGYRRVGGFGESGAGHTFIAGVRGSVKEAESLNVASDVQPRPKG